MNTKEIRQIWAKINPDGEVDGYTWALCGDPAELPAEVSPSWGCALTPEEKAAGWTAVPSSWRRVPVPIRGKKGQVVDGKIQVNGLAYHMADRGRARAVGQEPDEPDVEIVDEAAARAALADGEAYVLRERGTGDELELTKASMVRRPSA